MALKRQDRLVSHYIRAFGIAAVYVEHSRRGLRIGFMRDVGATCPRERRLLCCDDETRAMNVAMLAQERLRANGMRRATFNDGLLLVADAAAALNVHLTPHDRVVDRATKAVQAIDQQLAAMRANGGLKALSRAYLEARAAGETARGNPGETQGELVSPPPSFSQFIHNWKLKMLDALAAESKCRTSRP